MKWIFILGKQLFGVLCLLRGERNGRMERVWGINGSRKEIMERREWGGRGESGKKREWREGESAIEERCRSSKESEEGVENVYGSIGMVESSYVREVEDVNGRYIDILCVLNRSCPI